MTDLQKAFTDKTRRLVKKCIEIANELLAKGREKRLRVKPAFRCKGGRVTSITRDHQPDLRKSLRDNFAAIQATSEWEEWLRFVDCNPSVNQAFDIGDSTTASRKKELLFKVVADTCPQAAPPRYEEQSFKKAFAPLKRRILTRSRRVRVYAPICGLNAKSQPLNLGSNWALRPFTDEEMQELLPGDTFPSRNILLDPFAAAPPSLLPTCSIVYDYQIPVANAWPILTDVVTTVAYIVKALRVFGHREVGCPSIMSIDLDEWFGKLRNYAPSPVRPPVWYMNPFAQPAILGDFASLWQNYPKQDQLAANKWLALAIDRLSSSMEKQTDEDRAIDLFIGLEALLNPLTKAKEGVAFRTALSAALFLGGDSKVRKRIFDDVKDSYNKLRGRLMHGAKVSARIEVKGRGKLTVTKVANILEDYLRQAIKKVILDVGAETYNSAKFREELLFGADAALRSK